MYLGAKISRVTGCRQITSLPPLQCEQYFREVGMSSPLASLKCTMILGGRDKCSYVCYYLRQTKSRSCAAYIFTKL